MKQKLIYTECITNEDGSQTYIVREPNGRCLKVCDSIDGYTEFCVSFFVEPKNEKQDEGKK